MLFFMFIAFECFYSSELWSLWIKTIRKLACEEFLATKYTKRKAQKHSKGFFMFFPKITTPVTYLCQNPCKKRTCNLIPKDAQWMLKGCSMDAECILNTLSRFSQDNLASP